MLSLAENGNKFSPTHIPNKSFVICEIEKVNSMITILNYLNDEVYERKFLSWTGFILNKMANIHPLDHLLRWIEAFESTRVTIKVSD